MPPPRSQSASINAPETRWHTVSMYTIVAIWLVLAIAGMLILVQYSSLAAPGTKIAETWPLDSALSPSSGEASVMVFLHPKCSCSVATIRQLATICAKLDTTVSMTTVFYCPANQSAEWAHTDLWHSCERLPGMTCVVDYDGQEAAKFGVLASGHILLFDSSGHRTFDGGITPSRAHEGACFGADALTELLSGRTCDRTKFPVFGCAIHADPSEQPVSVSPSSE